jgi:hypothetical protein
MLLASGDIVIVFLSDEFGIEYAAIKTDPIATAMIINMARNLFSIKYWN